MGGKRTTQEKEGDDLLCATRYALMSLRHRLCASICRQMAPAHRISGPSQPDKVHKVGVQIKAPRGSDPGHVEEAWYVVFENNVILTDQDGKPSRAFRSNM